MKLLDRITLESVDIAQFHGVYIIPQQYLLLEDWSYNSHYTVPKGTVLCNDDSSMLHMDGHKLLLVKQELSDNIHAAITQIAATTRDYLSSSTRGSWPSPLIPRQIFEEASILSPVEEMLDVVMDAGHLHTISNRPRIDMRYEEALMPISRAKKIANNAHRHLAMHSETWQQRTLTGIYPKKVMARLSEDEWQLYENKVYARLLDKLYRFLKHRRAELIEQKQNIEDGLNLEGGEGLYYKLADVLYKLWGENWRNSSANNTLEQLEETMKSLNALIGKLSLLRQAGIYLKIPKAAQVPDQLHMTNILSHDQHYRHIARLWNSLYSVKARNYTAAEKLEYMLNLQKDYSIFSLLIICRAFESLGFNFSVKEKDTFIFTKRAFIVKIILDHSHSWIVSSNLSEYPIRIIPILNQPMKSIVNNSNKSEKLYLFYLIGRENTESAKDVGLNHHIHANPLNFKMIELFAIELFRWLYQDVLSNYAESLTFGRLPQSVKSILEKTDGLERFNDKYAVIRDINISDMEKINIACDQVNTETIFKEIKDKVDALRLFYKCPLCDCNTDFESRKYRSFKVRCRNDACGILFFIKIDAQKKRRFELKISNDNSGEKGRWQIEFPLLDNEDDNNY